MTNDQWAILAILLATMALFLWGRLRHDVVALAALLAAVLAGLVPTGAAFAGFGHPAVITVAAVLILSKGLQNTGAVDLMAGAILPQNAGRAASMAALLGLGAALSAVMNNVGAMALLMPVALRLSDRLGLTAGQVLMPLAFGTILGGMTTLIGTPPNLIVSGFRAQAVGQGFGGQGFSMFDFAPVGGVLAVLGVGFLALAGWRLVPARNPSRIDDFDTGTYLTEARTREGAKAVGMTLRQFEALMPGEATQVVAMIRNGVRMTAPHGGRRLAVGDILVLEADVKVLQGGLESLGLEIATAGKTSEDDGAEGIALRELVVLPGAGIIGQSASGLGLRSRHGLNLLAISRGGTATHNALRKTRFLAGDVLLLQGAPEAISEFAADAGCVPLADRDIASPSRRRAGVAVGIMAGAVGLSAFAVLATEVAFMLAVLATMLTGTVPLRKLYEAIDWPVVVLLAALIPVAGAMETTGAAAVLAAFLMDTLAQGNAVVALTLILVVTMTLSDVMNNAATAAVMSPIALQTATALGASPDAFLMAVAIGASCAFLTPIGHQNNTLILGPGGFRFGDYWRLGLPLEVGIVALSVPLLLVFWPL